MTKQVLSAVPAKARLLLSISFALAIGLALTGALDKHGEEYTSDTLKRSLAAFAIARGLNGVISVAQGTELAVQPAGIGVNFAPGEILDPINDLVERFSWVMLLSSTSLGLQQILLSISTWYLFTTVVIAVLIVGGISLWMRSGISAGTRRFILKLSLALMIFRFAVPFMAIANEWIYKEFLSDLYSESTAKLSETTDHIRELNRDLDQTEPDVEDESLLGSVRQLVQSAASSVDLDARLEQYKASASAATLYAINLIVVFVFQTIILPLGFLFFIYLILKRLLSLNWS
ncbi:MAG: hypothetical protein AAF542_05605 [Pseudomonadota bacterium]